MVPIAPFGIFGSFVWLGVGVVVLVVLLLMGRRPRLAGVAGEAAETDPPAASSHVS